MKIAEMLQFLPLVLSLILSLAFLADWNLGKFLYWFGAAILTVGIIVMK